MEKAHKIDKNHKKQHSKPRKELEKVVIRLAGDSGDGMQLAGLKFTSASVILGNDVSTVPDFPLKFILQVTL
jgi:2-oxoglutarate ferredoxin oxidoreductase subunit alpha